jgi:hypothetical protein
MHLTTSIDHEQSALTGGNIDIAPRRARARAKDEETLTAVHEAGHAIGRFFTHELMAVPEEVAIVELIIYEQHGGRVLATHKNNPNLCLVSAAECTGPIYSFPLEEISEDIYNVGAEQVSVGRDGLLEYTVRDPFRLKADTIAAGRARGVDVESWLAARAIIAVAGPVVEARYTRKPFWPIWAGPAGVHDKNIIAEDCAAAELYEDEHDALVRHARKWCDELIRRPDVWTAVLLIADELLWKRRLDGAEVIRIIKQSAVR